MCPKRGLGDATVQMLHDHARKRRIPLFEAARAVVETDELKPKARGSLRDLILHFDRWRAQREVTSHTALAEIVLDESGYTEMWQKDRSADAAGRLDNLKELVRSMEEFENLQGFLEHISLVMDRDGGAADEAVSLMTLHSAKGLEFDNVFLPGWEEGLFPSQRTLDEQGRAGLEEERRLAHVGLTRARRRAKLYFATNRRIHGTWSTTIPSRFLDELPSANVEITESKGGSGWGGSGGYGPSRFDNVESFGSSYTHAGLAARAGQSQPRPGRPRTGPRRFRGKPVAIFRLAQRYRLARRYLLRRRLLAQQARPDGDRRRAGREIHRHRFGILARRPRVSPEIRLRQRGEDRRQQADDRVRKGRREEGGR